MNSSWYIVKVLPGKERQLSEQFNRDITSNKLKNIVRFVCPLENEYITQKNKKVLREKIIYTGYLYFEAPKRLTDDELKEIATIQNIMGMMGDRTPLLMRENDVRKIIKDELLEDHIESKKIKLIIGEKVTVTDGPFTSFEGTISEVKGDKVDINVKIFGRDTLVSLSLSQIKKC